MTRTLANCRRELAVAATYLALLLLLAVLTPTFYRAQFRATWVSAAPVLVVAVGMTLVILARHIDISVGAQFSLCGVIAGLLARADMPIGGVIGVTLLAGAAMGAVNGSLVAGLGLPSIVVTLATTVILRESLRLWREGDAVRGLPADFQWFGASQDVGQWTVVLAALLLFAIFACAMRWLAAGRNVYAVGSDEQAARLAGVRPQRVVFWVFVLTGALTGFAALLNAVRFANVDPNAGNGLELHVIAAVVVGGAAITGGRGTLLGTLLGLFAIAILQNGLRLADLPPELAGILTGLFLLIAIGFDWRPATTNRAGVTSVAATRTTTTTDPSAEEFDMKNSQVAVLSVVILVAALIIAGGNFLLVRSLRTHGTSAVSSAGRGGAPETSGGKAVTIAMMPKSKGNAYFIACRKGAEEAAKELGVELLWDGPTDPDPAKQNEIVETWITRGVDVIAVAVENREGIATALRKAKAAGIRVVTWDSDSEPDARDFFVNQATPQGIGQTLMDTGAKVMQDKGEFAVISASLTSANQNEWLKYIDQRLAEKYPGIKRVANRPCDDIQQKAFAEATALLNAHPNLKLLMAICSPAVPGAAEAVKQSGRTDVKVVGLGLPNDNKPYVHGGITDTVILWNTMDLGYLTVHASKALADGELNPGAMSFNAGRLGKLVVDRDNILLGQPFSFTKANIDQFDF